MESVFLTEKKIISLIFNPLRETVFLLSHENNNLDLTEENLSNNVIIKRFKLIPFENHNISNFNFKKQSFDSYEGYSIYFWRQYKKLIMTYPNGYLLIYDYISGSLDHQFQTRGKNVYIIRKIIGSSNSPILYFSAEGMRNIYCLLYDSISKNEKGIVYTKLVLPKQITVFDLITHPLENYLFCGCSDGIIRIFNTLTAKETPGLTDIPLGKDNKPQKNQSELLRSSNILGFLCLDINSHGNYLISGNENGILYLWDALGSMKGKRNLICKEKFSSKGILTCKFINMKQLENLDRIICLNKEGKVYILSIINLNSSYSKTFSLNSSLNKDNLKRTSLSIIKTYSFYNLYENNIFNTINYQISKYNITSSDFISFSYSSSFISIKWPQIKIEKKQKTQETTVQNQKQNEDYIIFSNFTSKCFFIYDNIYPKINLTMSTQLSSIDYENLIPTSSNRLIFQRFFYICDNYFIHQYDNINGSLKRLINYTKEINLKSALPLKFDSRPKKIRIDNKTDLKFCILLQIDSNKKILLFLQLDANSNSRIKFSKVFDDIIDYSPIGSEESELNEILMIDKTKQIASIYNISLNEIKSYNIEGSINRVYYTPFSEGYAVIYRNVLNQLKFSENINLSKFHIKSRENDSFLLINTNTDANTEVNYNEFTNIRKTEGFFQTKEKNNIPSHNGYYNFKNENKTALALDFSEREIDISWSGYYQGDYLCAISMIEKIIICNMEIVPLYKIKISLLENPNIISSQYWVGKTLLFTRGNNIYYYYPRDNIVNKIFTNNQTHTIISGILCDRMLLSNKIWGSNEVNNISVTTPIISPLEIILIGYLDYSNKDYNLIKDAVYYLSTNQISDILIKKLTSKNLNLKEISYNLIKDSKSSYPYINKILNISNDLLDYENSFDIVFPQLDTKNKIQLEDIKWKMEYDQNYILLKEIIKNQIKILIQNGQFQAASKFIEVISDFNMFINMVLYVSTNKDFSLILDKMNKKQVLNFSESLILNNVFLTSKLNQIDHLNNKSYEIKISEISKFNSIGQNNTQNNNQLKNNNETYIYNKIFDNYNGEPYILGVFDSEFLLKVKDNKDILHKINKNNSHIHNIQKRNMNFDESIYSQYVEVYNSDTQLYDNVPILSLILNKVEHSYGYSNTKSIQKQKFDFYEGSVPLSQINNAVNEYNNNKDNTGKEDDEDPSLLDNIDDVNEALYLIVYLRCEKGYGKIVEDITNNENNGVLSFEPQMSFQQDSNSINNDQNDFSEDKLIWSLALEENEPLELDDKWGRKTTQSHSIIFKEELKTSLTIKHSISIKHFSRHFTIEFWLKPYTLNTFLFKKESFHIQIVNGEVISLYNNKEYIFELRNNSKLNSKIQINKWVHLALKYSKTSKELILLINGEYEYITKIQLNENLDSIGDIVFGDKIMNGEITELRIWNKAIPILFIKDNMRCPLAILSENKRKAKIKIGVKEDNKKLGFKQFQNKFNIPKAKQQEEEFENKEKEVEFENGFNNFEKVDNVNQSNINPYINNSINASVDHNFDVNFKKGLDIDKDDDKVIKIDFNEENFDF